MVYFTAKDRESRALLKNCPVSMKYSVEMASFLKGKKLDKAIAYCDSIIAKERFLPFKRYKGSAGHRPGKEANIKIGRYPVKIARYFKKALLLAKSNALSKSLKEDMLFVEGCVLSKGNRRPKIQPQGRRRLRYSKAVHIEVLLRDRSPIKKVKEKTENKGKK